MRHVKSIILPRASHFERFSRERRKKNKNYANFDIINGLFFSNEKKSSE